MQSGKNSVYACSSLSVQGKNKYSMLEDEASSGNTEACTALITYQNKSEQSYGKCRVQSLGANIASTSMNNNNQNSQDQERIKTQLL